MFSKNVFQICLIISIFAHLGIVMPWPFSYLFLKKNLDPKHSELIYLAGRNVPDIQISKSAPMHSKNSSQKNGAQSEFKAPDKGDKDKGLARQDEIKKSEKLDLKKEDDGKKNTAEVKNSAIAQEAPIVDIGTQKGVAYEKYYRDVRDKIKAIIEKNKAEFFTAGEIYVRFILDRSGALRDVALYGAGSGETSDLSRLAIKSINEAAPFPPFTDKIKEDELQFNLPIRVMRKN